MKRRRGQAALCTCGHPRLVHLTTRYISCLRCNCPHYIPQRTAVADPRELEPDPSDYQLPEDIDDIFADARAELDRRDADGNT
jgi:hypothetical protein